MDGVKVAAGDKVYVCLWTVGVGVVDTAAVGVVVKAGDVLRVTDRVALAGRRSLQEMVRKGDREAEPVSVWELSGPLDGVGVIVGVKVRVYEAEGGVLRRSGSTETRRGIAVGATPPPCRRPGP